VEKSGSRRQRSTICELSQPALVPNEVGGIAEKRAGGWRGLGPDTDMGKRYPEIGGRGLKYRFIREDEELNRIDDRGGNF